MLSPIDTKNRSLKCKQNMWRMHSNDEVATIGIICFVGGVLTICISIFIFLRVIQHLYCIPHSNSTFEPRHIKIYSVLSVISALISIIVTFSSFPVCAQWSCDHSELMWLYLILLWTFYIPAKVFLYLIFISRLFNPHYHLIYQYPKWIKYFLRIMLTILVLDVLVGYIEYGLLWAGVEDSNSLQPIGTLTNIVYGLTDGLLSIFTMSLFFIPLCCMRSAKIPSSATNIYMRAAKRYCFISLLQLISTLSFQVSFMISMYLSAINASNRVWDEYYCEIRIIQMLDCMLLIFCIYFGFRRKTVCTFESRDLNHLQRVISNSTSGNQATSR